MKKYPLNKKEKNLTSAFIQAFSLFALFIVPSLLHPSRSGAEAARMGGSGALSQVCCCPEKGVDAALTVHLFDTEEAWDHAFLLSGDADFTPAVRSLRRRGKLVSGAGFTASRALLRELHDFTDLTDSYLRNDFAAFKMFRTGGLVENWLTSPVVFEEAHKDRLRVVTRVKWSDKSAKPSLEYSEGRPLLILQSVSILFEDEGLFDTKTRDDLLSQFTGEFPELKWTDRHFMLKPSGWMSVERRLPELVRKFKGTMVDSMGQIEASFEMTQDQSGWQLEKAGIGSTNNSC